MSIKVLVVDDSAIVRQTLQRELSRVSDIQVVGAAPDPYVARDKIVELQPDVITLDIEMPRLDGLSFLRKLMQHHPVPVIIVSSLVQKGSEVALEALQSGALDVICKPGEAYSVGDMTRELIEKIRAAAKVDVSKLTTKQSPISRTSSSKALVKTTNKVILIGASTGGVQTLEFILKQFPGNAPGTVVVQHMPAGFTKSFADRLNATCEVEVKEAVSGETVAPGKVLIAPGNTHTVIKRSGAQYYVEVTDGPLVNQHRPSVEVLFQSAASYVAGNAIGVMLTGMGADGAKGMKKLKDSGAFNIAQDEASCIVFGMPKAAIEADAVHEIVSLQKMAEMILRRV